MSSRCVIATGVRARALQLEHRRSSVPHNMQFMQTRARARGLGSACLLASTRCANTHAHTHPPHMLSTNVALCCGYIAIINELVLYARTHAIERLFCGASTSSDTKCAGLNSIGIWEDKHSVGWTESSAKGAEASRRAKPRSNYVVDTAMRRIYLFKEPLPL